MNQQTDMDCTEKKKKLHEQTKNNTDYFMAMIICILRHYVETNKFVCLDIDSLNENSK